MIVRFVPRREDSFTHLNFPRYQRGTVRPFTIRMQMPTSLNLAVNRIINQFQRLIRGHGAAKMRHTYTLVWRSTATFILRRVCYARLLTSTHIHTSTGHCPVQGTGTSRSEPGFSVCWLIKDRLRRSYKATFDISANGYVMRTELRPRALH